MKIDAIVDTNVLLDIYSITDPERAYEEGSANDEKALFRRVRIRESLLLGWYLHTRSMTTLSLAHEATTIAKRVVPPEDRLTLAHQHMTLSLYLQGDLVLRNWKQLVDTTEGLTGHACDSRILELAKKWNAPIVTNEGYSIRGVSNDDKKKLRSRALEQGLRVFTPREFWQHNMGEAATRKFVRRFDVAAKTFARSHSNSPAVKNAIAVRRGILNHVFFGLTADGRRLPVRLPG